MHQHLCLACRGEVLPPKPLSEGHVAVRFKNHLVHGIAHVTLDGVEVSSDCSEAFPGADGWVVLMCSPRVVCLCGKDVCRWIARGSVTVWYELVALEPS